MVATPHLRADHPGVRPAELADRARDARRDHLHARGAAGRGAARGRGRPRTRPPAWRTRSSRSPRSPGTAATCWSRRRTAPLPGRLLRARRWRSPRAASGSRSPIPSAAPSVPASDPARGRRAGRARRPGPARPRAASAVAGPPPRRPRGRCSSTAGHTCSRPTRTRSTAGRRISAPRVSHAAEVLPHARAELEWMVTAAPRAILDGRPLPERPPRASRSLRDGCCGGDEDRLPRIALPERLRDVRAARARRRRRGPRRRAAAALAVPGRGRGRRARRPPQPWIAAAVARRHPATGCAATRRGGCCGGRCGRWRSSARWRRGYARVPRVLPRALATIPLAAAHARRLQRERRRARPRRTSRPTRRSPRGSTWRLDGRPVQLHRARSRPLRPPGDACTQGGGRRLRGRDLRATTERFLLEHAAAASPRVVVVHCGVDPEPARLPRARAGAGRRPVSSPCVAALRPPTRATPCCCRRSPAPGRRSPTRGSSSSATGPLRAELEAQARALGLGGPRALPRQAAGAGGRAPARRRRRLRAAERGRPRRRHGGDAGRADGGARRPGFRPSRRASRASPS